MQKIADDLLAASYVDCLLQSVADLPHIPTSFDDHPTTTRLPRQPPEPLDEWDHLVQIYQCRRTDYLRRYCRALAPISLDVCARVVTRALAAMSTTTTTTMASGSGSSNDNDDDSSVVQQRTLALVLLLGEWLPVAPHLAPLAQDALSKLFAVGGGQLQQQQSPLFLILPNSSDGDMRERFLLSQALYQLCVAFRDRGELFVLLRMWDWSPIFVWLSDCNKEEEGSMAVEGVETPFAFDVTEATLWYVVRVAAYCLRLAPYDHAQYCQRHKVSNNWPLWIRHPWHVEEEEKEFETLQCQGRVNLWNTHINTPHPAWVRPMVSLHSSLVDVAPGLVFYKQNALEDTMRPPPSSNTRPLVRTETTLRNLTALGDAFLIDPAVPILLSGPPGSGKSSLMRHLARELQASLLELHVDEDTDTKTLVGSYTTTEVPGEFAWRPGALTRAVRAGQWVLFEDLDRVPTDIQASLVQLFKRRHLPLGNGRMENCHPNFRIFATMSKHDRKNRVAGVFSAHYWRNVEIEAMTVIELQRVALRLYPTLPPMIVNSALQIFGRVTSASAENDEAESAVVKKIAFHRCPSVRDLFKLLSRISRNVAFEANNCTFATENQRMLCLAENFDVFVASHPNRDTQLEFVRRLAAPLWSVSGDLARAYLLSRRPQIIQHDEFTEVGRVRLALCRDSPVACSSSAMSAFTHTSSTLRLMETIAVCVQQTEPILLCGETGSGKTTIVQQLARLAGQELVVQNLSLQTDSSDLLGGYRPLEIAQAARKAYEDFFDLFCASFSRTQNAAFLGFAASALQLKDWKKLSQCFNRAAKLGLKKVFERNDADKTNLWQQFSDHSVRFENQRVACESSLAFAFSEGALVDAIRAGKWILLDEINLASSETIQRLCGLLDETNSSITLAERGDAEEVKRHLNFRLFAAMNPATDGGKKDLSPSIRPRFTEVYVNELLDPVELRLVAARYMSGVAISDDRPTEHSDVIISAVDLYLKCRDLSSQILVDGAGQRPRYTLRSLTRALLASRSLMKQQKLPLKRALVEGFELAFLESLDSNSRKVLQELLLKAFGDTSSRKETDLPGRRPGREDEYVLLAPFWVKKGSRDVVDWSEYPPPGRSKFILTPSAAKNVRKLARLAASGNWPVLLEGPTSGGKTTLIEYLAARCGQTVVRINNHEHTDIQEYTGGFMAAPNGSLKFQDGLLVRALRQGSWIILDELNLAPSEVLEALNRLLDDNRELYLSETNETIRAHPDFRLFATQNPSGAYGGRKPLSRAFRNRFVEIFVADIPLEELRTILEKRSGCPASHAQALVATMQSLRLKRSKSGLFLGKDGLITPRDLLRWADRKASTREDVAREGYMLLAERLRAPDEKSQVLDAIEKHLKVAVNIDMLYYGDESEARQLLASATLVDSFLSKLAPTKSLLRLITLVLRCVKQREPVLLVGETGCGKTTVVQLISAVLRSRLRVVNCHATTETSDLLGGLRPLRGRESIARCLLLKLRKLISMCSGDVLESDSLPPFLSASSCQALLSKVQSEEFSDDAVSTMASVVSELRTLSNADVSFNNDSSRSVKRQRVDGNGNGNGKESGAIEVCMRECENLVSRYNSFFEWVDGPLVDALKHGDVFLLDEISLADDAVLERLNSVLEPGRSLVLAEKTCGVSESQVIHADENFHFFATMNPGGDYGKRELSPALRSRFTEIWIPDSHDYSDIKLVLDASLWMSHLQPSVLEDIKNVVMDYLRWFNLSYCRDKRSLHPGLVLSLRDLKCWASFIVQMTFSNPDLDIWEALYHGACLMHLDGLGLGIGIAPGDAAAVKHEASSTLYKLIWETGSKSSSFVEPVSFSVEEERCGIHPFYIRTRAVGPKTPSFCLAAPTPLSNAFKVFRALQLNRPILLEGPPGVGKSSLIASLAAVSGNKLVRINLSEQTDMSDLFGSDLPMSEANSHGTSTTAFKWCDGALLVAIKEGAWVLLDELNLANQTVLEGLNSCLDHRSNIFIPELGETFSCPASFRVFAAQNPVGEGAGRKGLPRSFLNRFTKVYLGSLSDDDLSQIVGSAYPQIAENAKKCLITLNKQLFTDVVVNRMFAHAGSPWEFNLRDIFRLCESLSTVSVDAMDAERIRHIVNVVYASRFRSISDRAEFELRNRATFGGREKLPIFDNFNVKASTVEMGTVELARHFSGNWHFDDSYDPKIKSPVLNSASAVALCVERNWPALIVGRGWSGKDTLVTMVAASTNVKLVEVSLCSSSDVSELIGSFEQVSCLDSSIEAIGKLQAIAYALVASSHACKRAAKIFHLSSQVDASFRDKDAERSIELGMKLAMALDAAIDISPDSSSVVNTAFLSLQQNLENRRVGQFEWKDGVLVTAMKKGSWLHLKNVNLCPAAVLDRLNSVLEPDGGLLLSECGASATVSGKTATRIYAHDNFRVFFSMNPMYGEISRAMRNRCLEISVLEESETDGRSNWLTDDSWQFHSTKSLLDNSEIHPPPCRKLRGLLAYSCNCLIVAAPTLFVPALQWEWSNSAYLTLIRRDTSVMQTLKQFPERNQIELVDIGSAIPFTSSSFSHLGGQYTLVSRIREVAQMDISVDYLIRHLMARFLGKARLPHEITDRLRFLASADGRWSVILAHACRVIFKNAKSPLDGGSIDSDLSAYSPLQRTAFWRFPAMYSQLKFMELVEDGSKDESNKSVLAVSFLLSEDILHRGSVDCALTPFLYPLLMAVEKFLRFCDRESFTTTGTAELIVDAFRQHDLLWEVLIQCKYEGRRSAQRVKFDYTEVIVLWTQLRRSLLDLEVAHMRQSDFGELRMMMQKGDQVIFGDSGPVVGFSILKFAAKPCVPRRRQDWTPWFRIRQIARNASSGMLFKNSDLSSEVTIDIVGAIQQTTPALFIDDHLRKEMLAAVTTSLCQAMEVFSDFNEALCPQNSSVVTYLKHRVELAELDFKCSVDRYLTHRSNGRTSSMDGIDSPAFTESQNADYCGIDNGLLRRFASLQLFPLYEVWCATEERFLVSELCKSVLNRQNSLEFSPSFSHRVERFIEVSLNHTSWDIIDLRPYQALHWATETTTFGACFDSLLRKLLPTMLLQSTSREWSKPDDRLKRLCPDLELDMLSGLDGERSRVLSPPSKNIFHTCASVSTATAFSLVGRCFSVSMSGRGLGVYSTIMNHEARAEQAATIVRQFSKLQNIEEPKAFDEVLYRFHDILDALLTSFPVESQLQLNSLHREQLFRLNVSDVSQLFKSSRNCCFTAVVDSLVLPLFECLKNLHGAAYTKIHSRNEALAQIYVGLIKFHLLLPDSPADPGREAQAVVSLTDKELMRICAEINAINADMHAVGWQEEEQCEVDSLYEGGEKLLMKRNVEASEIIERGDESPDFFDLYMTFKDVAQKLFSPACVLALIDDLSKPTRDGMLQRESNWQKTSEAFCLHAISSYEAYEDVVTPMVDAIAAMKRGVSTLREWGTEVSWSGHFLSALLAFPMSRPLELSEALGDGMQKLLLLRDSGACSRSIGLAVLAALRLESRHVKTKGGLKLWCQTVDMLAGNVNKGCDFAADITEGFVTDDDDREFRTVFPNHDLDFSCHMSSSTADDDASFSILPEFESNSKEGGLPMSSSQVGMICALHREIFVEDLAAVDDVDRLQYFQLRYGAAHLLFEHLDNACQLAFPSSSHAIAFALQTAGRQTRLSPLPIADTNKRPVEPRFHHDPNPSEVVRSRDALNHLRARLAQLIAAFPDNEILVTLARVSDSVCKLDASVVSVGKVMTGLELILRRAQEWEEHASKRVKIGQPLAEVSQLVAFWREKELKSWPTLLEGRQVRFVQRAREHWISLHNILTLPPGTELLAANTEAEQAVLVPRWVFKNSGFSRVFESLPAPPEILLSTLKTLDTFVLTSSVGEFSARLELLQAFFNQLCVQIEVQGPGQGRLHLMRCIYAIWAFYHQYTDDVIGHIRRERTPIEVRLHDYMKLARWDEQSYYALAESSEKNHRRIMTILKEFDAILETGVTAVLETSLSLGLQSSTGANDFTMPSHEQLFPTAILGDGRKSDNDCSQWSDRERVHANRDWTDVAVLRISPGLVLANISRYFGRMYEFRSTMVDEGVFVLKEGTITASAICDSIFQRLDSLRRENASKQMKGKALVDLLRELRRQGLAATMWSVPLELNDPSEMFLLPVLKPYSKMASDVTSLDQYFSRCVAETKKFRDEATVVGSKHLSSREIHIMTSLSGHALHFLVQQRCMLVMALTQVKELENVIGNASRMNVCLPLPHDKVCNSIENYAEAVAVAMEGIHQLRFYVETCIPLLREEENGWANKAIISLVDCASCLESFKPPPGDFFTNASLVTMRRQKDSLANVASRVQQISDEVIELECLPKDGFENCLTRIKVAHQAAEHFLRDDDVTHVELGALTKENFVEVCSRVSTSAVLSVQECRKALVLPMEEKYHEISIVLCHQTSCKAWELINLRRFQSDVAAFAACFKDLHNLRASDDERLCCFSLASDVALLCSETLSVVQGFLGDYIAWSRATAKLQYVITRIFRVLMSRGFCSNDGGTNAETDGHGDASGMTFEDRNGVGMADGEGSKDVTDEIENEEQLLGVKNDKADEDQTNSATARQLGEEEAGKGLEMEEDFEGEMCDVPENATEQENEDIAKGEEEVDREMGNERSANEEVIDEKMWGLDDDDDERSNQGKDELTEKNSGTKSGAQTEEVMTKTDDEENDNKESADQLGKPHLGDGADDIESEVDAIAINEDNDDKYEENHGVEVKGEVADGVEKEEGMQLDEDMSIQDDEDGSCGGAADCARDDGSGPDEEASEANSVDNSEELRDAEDYGCDTTQAPESEEGHNEGVAAEIVHDQEGADAEEAENLKKSNVPLQSSAPMQGLGVSASDGNDHVQYRTDPDDHGAGEGDKGDVDVEPENLFEPMQEPSGGDAGINASDSGAQSGSSYSQEANSRLKQKADTIPNPFKSPGDAREYWNKRLNMIESQSGADETEVTRNDKISDSNDGTFEYVGAEQSSTAQALGEAEDVAGSALDETNMNNEDQAGQESSKIETEETVAASRTDVSKLAKESISGADPDANEYTKSSDTIEAEAVEDDIMAEEEMSIENDSVCEADGLGSHVVSDLARLQVQDGSIDRSGISSDAQNIEEDHVQTTGLASSEGLHARERWANIHADTHPLARRLCEKLRLVMEPLVASKLRGDYRTGKRINMKRIIGYIASGYRKDKIWLRRTKPAKRNYRVLVAVDDSLSMQGGAGDMALRALATLALGMSQLEIGQIGVASFGNEMRLLHPFDQPFTAESGMNVVANFQFDQPRTRTALCVESAMRSLDVPGDVSSLQLVFLVSDGRIERDSRTTLRRLIREMMERNILLAMIIVQNNTKDSIVNMKEVAFDNGTPVMKSFMEEYPFPYYIVLDDVEQLPEVLGDALRQWFEMLAQLQQHG